MIRFVRTTLPVLSLMSLMLLVGCQPPKTGGSKELADRIDNLEKKVDTKADKPVAKPQPKQQPVAGQKNEGTGSVVLMKTSLGEVGIQLFEDKAPLSVANFMTYVDAKYYDGTIFHRVIPTFMIQGGGFDKDINKKKTRGPVKNESSNGLTNSIGSIAMARTNNPNSATSQFFINVKNNKRLDNYGGGYTVFGEVISGMEVVNKIRDVPTGRCGNMPNCPTTPVIIESIRKK